MRIIGRNKNGRLNSGEAEKHCSFKVDVNQIGAQWYENKILIFISM